MAVYACGGEADTFDLPAGMSFTQDTTSGRFEPNLSRGAMLVVASSSELSLPFNTTLSDFWIHMRLYQGNYPAATSTYFVVQNAAATEDEYRVQIDASGYWTIHRWNGTTYVLLGTTTGVPLAAASVADFDIHIVRNAMTGLFQIFKNGVSIYSFTGDTSTANAPGSLYLKGIPAGSGTQTCVSQLMIADESTIGWKLATLYPTANGASTSWTGDYTTIDEFVYDNTDFIETNVVGNISTFANSTINSAYSTYNVKALAVAARMSNDSGSAVADVQFVVRTAGTNYTSPNTSLTKDGQEHSKQYVWNNNPNTSGVWSQAQINGAEIGVKSV